MATSLNPDGTNKSIYQLTAEQIARDNTIDPTLNTFDESKGVAGRVSSLIAQDSPLMQQAKTKGTQLAASRGLTNSTLAGEAEQNAVLAAATPIATADAGLYQQVQQANQTASNAAKTGNAQTGAQTALTGLQVGESARQSDQSMQMAQKQLDTQKEQFAQQLGVTVQDLDLRRNTLTQQQQQFLAKLDFDKSQLAQQLQIAQMNQTTQGSTTLANAWGTMMTNIQAIQNNANLDGPAKQTLVQNALDSFASYAKFWQKMSPIAVDIGPLLDFGTVGAAPNASGGSTPGAGVSPGSGPPPVYTAPYVPPGGSDPGSTCFPAGALVLMANGQTKAIETIEAGELVMGMDGPTPVLEVERPLLGARRMMSFPDGHRWSEEHSHWTRAGDGTQFWWAENKPMWVAEAVAGAIGGLRDNDRMRTGAVDAFAHLQGWKDATPRHEPAWAEDTQLYITKTSGSPIVVDGYVVGACIDWRGFDYDSFDWNEARTRIA